jgi:dTDP-4-amino-4,6-dideoxygalactose transaminase
MNRKNHQTMQIPGRIPFDDLITPQLELQEELLAVFRSVLRTGIFLGGVIVEDFEREFAAFCGTRYCIGVGRGTDALRLALMAAGVRPGDVVLTVPNTLAATTDAIFQTGACPAFVDIDERTYSMDWKKLQEHLETRCQMDLGSGKLVDNRTHKPVSAVVPVHLYGQTADMDQILKISEEYGLTVVADACQAHSAEYFSRREDRWTKVGSIGCAAAFSFHPRAILGACGTAGAVTTNDPEIAHEVQRLRQRGYASGGHDCSDCQLDAIQAGVLHVKLRHVVSWNKKRRENAFCYHGLLASAADVIRIPNEPSWARATYDSYVIRTDHRDELQSYLFAENIATEVNCAVPLHLRRGNRDLGYRVGDFPVSEKVASEILSLPIYPQLEFDQLYRVAQKVLEFVGRANVRVSRSRTLSPYPLYWP